MINVSELRVGNWITDRYTLMGDTREVQVLALHSFNGFDSINASTAKDYEPIPLTSEILEACGFENGGDDGYTNKGCDLFTVYLNDGVWYHIWDAAFTGAQCHYLHQLQNLYYALTGNEITYNPK